MSSLLRDFHVHTSFCDGDNSPEEMVRAALDLKMEYLGFSGHSYAFFDAEYSLRDISGYLDEINMLKEKYKGKIKILCGCELDYYSKCPSDIYDYIIGSVHYLKTGYQYPSIDFTPEMLKNLTNDHFNGDYLAVCEEYYRLVSDVVRKTNADIIGHFDLITKFNKELNAFSEQDERYISAYKKAILTLIKYNKPFEVNTSPIFKGIKDEPYPSLQIIREIKHQGGKFILSSDSHNPEMLCYDFEKWDRIIKEI